MKTRNITFKGLMLSLLIVACWGCKESVQVEDTAVPSPLSNVSVTNIVGGVEVTYNQPTDKNVNLVTAEYATDEGGREIKRFGLEENKTGFRMTGVEPTQKTLELYTVSHSGVRSESVFFDIQALESPTQIYLDEVVLPSIGFLGILGGVTFNFENPDSKELTFVVEVREGSTWREHSRHDTDEQNGLFILEDFDFTEYRVYIQYQDEDNEERSAAKMGTAQALEEFVLDKSKWSVYKGVGGTGYPGDNWDRRSNPETTYGMITLWDGIVPPNNPIRFENKALPLPHSFTIDLGADQQLAWTRIRIYHHAVYAANIYGQRAPKTIEIWGSNDPDTDGGWTQWDKVTTAVSRKPYETGAENLAYLQAGEVFDFPLFTPAYRYIRFNVLDTWTGLTTGDVVYIQLQEVTLYGVEQ